MGASILFTVLGQRDHVAMVGRTSTSHGCTHRIFLVVKKTFFSFPVVVNSSVRSFGFLVINVCSHGENCETPRTKHLRTV
jgi:hypothetical protein